MLDTAPEAAAHKVAVLRQIAGRPHKIDFGVNALAGRGSFNAAGDYAPLPGSDGLTCATLVVELLRAAGIDLIAESTWLPDIANNRWIRDVCTMLRETGATEAHISKVSTSFNGVRVRPEEVMAAASLPASLRPMHYATASGLTPSVIKHFSDCCSFTVWHNLSDMFLRAKYATPS